MTSLAGTPLTEPAADSAPLTWQAVQAGLWVGRRDGQFAGMIEQVWGKGFTVTTAFGKQLGLFDTVDEAQAAIG